MAAGGKPPPREPALLAGHVAALLRSRMRSTPTGASSPLLVRLPGGGVASVIDVELEEGIIYIRLPPPKGRRR